jgi:membrane protease YdiL (CAAX protease family)
MTSTASSSPRPSDRAPGAAPPGDVPTTGGPSPVPAAAPVADAVPVVDGGPHGAPAPERPVGLDPDRPFGAHLRLAWWKPLLLVPGLLIAMGVLQMVLVLAVTLVEITAFGRDPLDVAISPLMLAAVNLSLAAMGPLAVLATALVARVPWRSLLAAPRGASVRRLVVCAGLFTTLVGAALCVSALIDPASVGIGRFAVTSTTVGLLLVALLTTPLQAAGEELMFRGAIMPLVASWLRPVRAALVVGMIASSIAFGLAHLSVDPWLLSYYAVFGLSMAAMAVISRGLEAPIAFHVMNNLIMMVIGALFAGGEGIVIDRSVGMGGPFMLVFIAVDLAAVGLVWLYERRLRP